MEHEQRSEEKRESGRPKIAAPGVETELAPVERLASGVGNRAFSALAREGAGILPDGRAHPDVEAAIGRTRGSGTTLDARSRERMGSALGDPLADVRVHTDETADALARAVSARAFTTGADLYFARGQFQPSSTDGQRLLAHELSHVVQQRGAPTSGPLVVSQPGESLEVEADAAARELVD
jgi:Domain of unknown function (DUF4157)